MCVADSIIIQSCPIIAWLQFALRVSHSYYYIHIEKHNNFPKKWIKCYVLKSVIKHKKNVSVLQLQP